MSLIRGAPVSALLASSLSPAFQPQRRYQQRMEEEAADEQQQHQESRNQRADPDARSHVPATGAAASDPARASLERQQAQSAANTAQLEAQLAKHRAFLDSLSSSAAAARPSQQHPAPASMTSVARSTSHSAGGLMTSPALPNSYSSMHAQRQPERDLVNTQTHRGGASQQAHSPLRADHASASPSASPADVSPSMSARELEHAERFLSGGGFEQESYLSTPAAVSPQHRRSVSSAASGHAGGGGGGAGAGEGDTPHSSTPRSTNSFGYAELALGDNVFALEERHMQQRSDPADDSHSSVAIHAAGAETSKPRHRSYPPVQHSPLPPTAAASSYPVMPLSPHELENDAPRQEHDAQVEDAVSNAPRGRQAWSQQQQDMDAFLAELLPPDPSIVHASPMVQQQQQRPSQWHEDNADESFAPQYSSVQSSPHEMQREGEYDDDHGESQHQWQSQPHSMRLTQQLSPPSRQPHQRQRPPSPPDSLSEHDVHEYGEAQQEQWRSGSSPRAAPSADGERAKHRAPPAHSVARSPVDARTATSSSPHGLDARNASRRAYALAARAQQQERRERSSSPVREASHPSAHPIHVHANDPALSQDTGAVLPEHTRNDQYQSNSAPVGQGVPLPNRSASGVSKHPVRSGGSTTGVKSAVPPLRGDASTRPTRAVALKTRQPAPSQIRPVSYVANGAGEKRRPSFSEMYASHMAASEQREADLQAEADEALETPDAFETQHVSVVDVTSVAAPSRPYIPPLQLPTSGRVSKRPAAPPAPVASRPAVAAVAPAPAPAPASSPFVPLSVAPELDADPESVVEAQLRRIDHALEVQKLRDEIRQLRSDPEHKQLFEQYERTIDTLQTQNASLRVRLVKAESAATKRTDGSAGGTGTQEHGVRSMEHAYRKQSEEFAALQQAHAALQKRERHFVFQTKQVHMLESRLSEQAALVARAQKDAQTARSKQDALQATNTELKSLVIDISQQHVREKERAAQHAEEARQLRQEAQRLSQELLEAKSSLVLQQARPMRESSVRRVSPATQRSEGLIDMSELESLLREQRRSDTPPTLVAAANRRALELLSRLRAKVDALHREHIATQANEKALLMMIIKLQEKRGTSK